MPLMLTEQFPLGIGQIGKNRQCKSVLGRFASSLGHPNQGGAGGGIGVRHGFGVGG